jgi:lysophospholipase L1-like esterase
MSGRIRTCLSTLVAVLAVPAAAGAASPTPRYYVALGDSLSQGMQPDAAGVTRNTDQGYADQLFQTERRGIKNLQLVKLGCGGESTSSMLTGHGNDRNAQLLHCNRTGGSQLTAAVRFLKSHHRAGEIALVTVDIGANDVDGCTNPGVNLGTCLAAGEASIKNNVPKILSAIKQAAPAKTALTAMTLYDPVLSEYFSPTGRSLALASPAILKTINGELASADANAGFRTADVGAAFLSYDGTDMVTWEGQQIPINVARVCSWTWACTTPPSGPNIHANKNGYAVIAQTFAKALGRLR